MKAAIKTITGNVIPMPLNDIDTDIIIPAQHLTQTSRAGYGQHAFARLKKADPEFVLNQPRFASATILVTGDNFGCGSSREHAVWAIQELGIQAVVAPSFADIFSNNAQKNHLPLITVDQSVCAQMVALAHKDNHPVTIDLLTTTLCAGGQQHPFTINPFFQHVLTAGLDELDYLMNHLAAIKRHHQNADQRQCFLQLAGALS
ncbi:3-isopropylmalate dehydratase small subunit [Marinicella sediminis]|uniref:3-isopropylmalate dehydratase n=1 Tax=Marinicella sediminis TaxID=1792834 RepID=A0ABV7J7J0_9GAMM|nr:3-isopropylmalate dehydratase small subunit [Marinicella sediminis]